MKRTGVWSRREFVKWTGGARTVTIVHLGNLAYWHRRKLRWDPQQWQFVGDAEANTWLDRPRRDPWKLPEV